MAKYAFIKFKINNDFNDWEQAFYAHQPIAREAGILELFHAKQADDPSWVAVLMTANSFEVFDEFMKNAAEDIAASGHILESTVTMYENQQTQINNASATYSKPNGAWVIGEEPAVNLEFSTDSKEFAAWTRGES